MELSEEEILTEIKGKQELRQNRKPTEEKELVAHHKVKSFTQFFLSCIYIIQN